MANTFDLSQGNSYTHYLRRAVKKLITFFKMLHGRMHYFGLGPMRFTGVFDTYDDAFQYAQTKTRAGYDNEEIVHVSFTTMCELAPWDYPVLFWLQRIMEDNNSIVDAGGHMGTKYRAFQNYLPFDEHTKWTVYDLPAIVRAGRKRALLDGLQNLTFCDDITHLNHADIFLGSGLMQYINEPLSEVLHRMKSLPQHIILNKVAFHDSGHLVTLENIGGVLVPYQMRNEREFYREITALGYQLVDEWNIPSLMRKIDTHPEIGLSTVKGFYFKL
ncbi:methyltransferase, TIGR04325 family [Ahrensia sp. 13_GOM-1096m]|uniref:methyltransferase, TIGR04325 family n=1 Tax=Ahrensia sp. 13_GOM-1096m TaxID=1380380 RepID=UPI00047B1733|nr:methyltransferase, TIGR04325 family [Ahrensia sp. 13_GOM-1096m]